MPAEYKGLKLGSLFSGSGSFELAGAMCNVAPVWASEIEKYPIAITTRRFPNMKHLGDIRGIDGGKIEPVDIITFGSPCTDLSLAGNREGLHKGERSSLFFEAIRIIKEMRSASAGIYPRIAVWENVTGAFSSHGGEDFRSALEAIVRVNHDRISLPRPEGRWLHAGLIVGYGYSVAWRKLNAIYWGVPQNRERIYLVADFRGERADKILFVEESQGWDVAASDSAWKSVPENPFGCAHGGLVYSVENYPNDSRVKIREDGTVQTLSAWMGTGGCNVPMVIELAPSYTCGNGQANGSTILLEEHSRTLDCMHDAQTVLHRDNSGKYIIRRLTPLEAVRLQGLPDWWLDGVKAGDAPKYKLMGNGLALPNAYFVIESIVNLIKKGDPLD